MAKQKLVAHKAHVFKDTVRVNSIVSVFYDEFSRNFVFSGEAHEEWELVYIDKGTAIVQAEDIVFPLSQGEITFHKPREFHAIKATLDNPPNIFVMCFTTRSPSIRFFEGYKAALPKALRYHITEILENAKCTFTSLSGNICLADSPVFGGEQMIKTHLEQLFIELMRNSTNNAFSQVKLVTENKTVAACIEYLEQNIYGKITIGDICAKLNYSRTYLCTLFRDVTGKSIMQYYNELKTEEAKLLIKKNIYTFSEISDLLCFNTPSYFSKVFRKIARMTPGEYKESLR